MIIYSWNMLFRNKRQDEAFAFIKNSHWDVFCLQEVPEEFLERLKALPYHLAQAIETRRLYKGKEADLYLVTLSRFAFKSTRETVTQNIEIASPSQLHSRLFTALMFTSNLWAKAVSGRGSLLTELETSNGTVNVLNLHLPLTTPNHRAEDFKNSMRHHDGSLPTIVCGDFNIVEKPHITLLNWLLGGSFSDWLHFTRERNRIESEFSSYSLVNPLRGISTHPLSRSQLDHILVSKHFKVGKSTVIRERYGSDHHPIRVEAA